MKNDRKICVKILVFGKVQGEFFRSYVKEKADEFDISGFTRNLDDGSVEIIAQGEKVEEFIESIKISPPFALVEKLDVSRETKVYDFNKFSIL